MTDGAYAQAYRRSLEDPDGFWGRAARDIDWITPPKRVLDDDRPPFYRWFTGGRLNTCFNALDRHVIAGRADQPALHHVSPVTGTTCGLPSGRRGVRVARWRSARKASEASCRARGCRATGVSLADGPA
ncbi:MAG: acetyl-coenzyme A synthetase N-terminal domain-containing protein, partial [Oryzihumus sp.]